MTPESHRLFDQVSAEVLLPASPDIAVVKNLVRSLIVAIQERDTAIARMRQVLAEADNLSRQRFSADDPTTIDG